MSAARILIVDDHPMVCESLAEYVERAEGLSVCAQAGSCAEGLALFLDSSPDLVVLDLGLPDQSGLEFIRALRKSGRDTPILVMTMHDESVLAARTLAAGADGFITKGESGRSLLEAIRTLLKGDAYLRGPMPKALVKRMSHAGDGGSGLDLTDREIEVFALVGRGKSSQEIAAALGRSRKTIDTHRENIKARLGLRNAYELSRAAILWVELGRIPTEVPESG